MARQAAGGGGVFQAVAARPPRPWTAPARRQLLSAAMAPRSERPRHPLVDGAGDPQAQRGVRRVNLAGRAPRRACALGCEGIAAAAAALPRGPASGPGAGGHSGRRLGACVFTGLGSRRGSGRSRLGRTPRPRPVRVSILHYAMLCYTVICYTIRCYTVLCYTIQYALQYYTPCTVYTNLIACSTRALEQEYIFHSIRSPDMREYGGIWGDMGIQRDTAGYGGYSGMPQRDTAGYYKNILQGTGYSACVYIYTRYNMPMYNGPLYCISGAAN